MTETIGRQQLVEMQSRAATLARVAEEAGVSTATVARVLNGRGYVAKETRIRVEEVLARTGYRPNAVARGLRTQRTFTLGHLLSRITFNPFFAEVARAVEDEAVRHNYRMFIVNLEGDGERERNGVLRLIESRVDAMIFTSAVDAENVALAVSAGIPVVQVERLVDCPTHAVVVDNMVGCSEAMRHLLELGHRRIGFLGADPALYRHAGPRQLSIEQERLTAYRRHLDEAGIGFDPELVRLGRYPAPAKPSANPASHSQGFLQMRELLQLRHQPTAVLVTADALAMGALQALYERGLRVPDDISVISYDDNLAPHLSPALTAVAQPTHEMGRAAFRLALDAIAGEREPRTVLLETCLHLRASTARPPFRVC